MKTVICGKGWIASDTLELLHDLKLLRAVDVEIIVVPSKSDPPQATWQPSLRATAAALGIDVAEQLEAIALQPGDVVLSLEYDRIIRDTQLRGARAYNVHFSDLPRYRGCATSVWPLLHGEQRAGVTLHVITPGIDDGPIVDQITFDIDETVSAFELYQAYHRHGYRLVARRLHDLLSAICETTEQDENQASYFSRKAFDYSKVDISDFHRPCVTVRDEFRARIFPPYQLPRFGGQKVMRAELLPAFDLQKASPGTTVEISSTRAAVRCLDGWLRLTMMPKEAAGGDPS